MVKKDKSQETGLPGDFGDRSHKTERSGAAVLMHWMRQIIDDKDIDLGMPDVETRAADNKMPDIIIYESRRSDKALCVIEAKPPYYDVFNDDELKEPAREKATKRRAKFFALTNFKTLVWFDTLMVNEFRPEEEQIVNKYSLSDIRNINDLERPRYADSTKHALEEFLVKLWSVHTGKEPQPKLPIDELLTFRLYEKIQSLAGFYRTSIERRAQADKNFRSALIRWFREQLWSFHNQPHDFDKVARQAAYMLVNKILFYNVLQSRHQDWLPPLELSPNIVRGGHFQKQLQTFYDEVLTKDFEPIFATNFIDSVCFPDSKELLREIAHLMEALRTYDLTKIGYDIIGRIFERMIPQEERHNFGQYFTNSNVVDLILRFCLRHEDDIIIDPSCGAGTFLVRAYCQKKLMNQAKDHTELLNTLWGDDIAKFPAHLAMINLAIRDLSVEQNYPNIIYEDFFKLKVGPDGFEIPPKLAEKFMPGLGNGTRAIPKPLWFDAIVGNPPYTRQEEIAEIANGEKDYKDNLIAGALLDNNGKATADIGKRAGIHAYFFIHGTKFLKEGGHFGFVVSDSWLDVDYGKGLQEFFLKNYKIIAIIESKVERWFEEADINTCIIILQKCRDEKERDDNLVRFVYLKKPLGILFPAADMEDAKEWPKQMARINAIDNIKKTIMAHNTLYENEDMKVFPKSQKQLWKEGFDHESREYVGSKWGRYLRAPKIYHRIVEKSGDKLVPLREIAEIRFGIKTGADPWFYVKDITDELKPAIIKKMMKSLHYRGPADQLRVIKSGDGSKWLVEKQYLKRAMRNPEEYKTINISHNNVNDWALIINESTKKIGNKLVGRYIRHGERTQYVMGKERTMVPAQSKSCAARELWYQLPDVQPARILWQKAFNIVHRHYFANRPILANQRFYAIYPKKVKDTEVIAALINTPLIAMYQEFQRGNLALGALEATVEEVNDVPVVDPKCFTLAHRRKISSAFSRMCKREIGSVFQEYGAHNPDDVELNGIQSDRRQLDKIVMGDILGLTDEEQLEVYRAVVDLVKSRIEKAKSVDKKKKTKEGIDIESFTKAFAENIGPETLGKFYRENILCLKPLVTKALPKSTGNTKIDNRLFEWRLYIGRKYIECSSEWEARYLKAFIDTGFEEVRIPRNAKDLAALVPPLEEIKEKMVEAVRAELEPIMSVRTRERLTHLLWAEIMK